MRSEAAEALKPSRPSLRTPLPLLLNCCSHLHSAVL